MTRALLLVLFLPAAAHAIPCVGDNCQEQTFTDGVASCYHADDGTPSLCRPGEMEAVVRRMRLQDEQEPATRADIAALRHEIEQLRKALEAGR